MKNWIKKELLWLFGQLIVFVLMIIGGIFHPLAWLFWPTYRNYWAIRKRTEKAKGGEPLDWDDIEDAVRRAVMNGEK